MHEHDDILVALVGQPNAGKSTVFNYLTGLHQTVANYPGVTTTEKSGHYHEDDHKGKRRIEVVDLPGTYSLTSYTQEERVTRDFLLLERPEVVVLVIDAANLRRHLYLAFQLRELQVPLIVCLNMMDTAQRRGFQIDVATLEQLLGVPVVPTIARCGQKTCTSACRCASNTKPPETGLEALRHQINVFSQKHDHEARPNWKIDYGELEPVIADIDALLAQKLHLAQDFPTRWLAIKLIENEREAKRIIQHHLHEPGWEGLVATCFQKIEHHVLTGGGLPETVIASKRNDYAKQIEKEAVCRISRPRRRSDRADRVLCHPIGGLCCVAAILLLIFSFAFNLADGWHWVPWVSEERTFEWQTPLGAVEATFDHWIPEFLDSTLALPEGDLRSLVYDGILAGVGAVITILPIIFLIFLFVSALEQSGYMARVVVVMDRLMRCFGLHGYSVVPMLLAGGIVGGCAVPAVMAARTMREHRERLLTMMILPLMNCGGKVPVYVLLLTTFFVAYQALMLAAIVLISWICALVAASLLAKWFIKGESSPLLIELPAYQVPRLRDVLGTAGLQSWWFLKRAGTVILIACIVLWALMYYPNREVETSYAAQVGQLFEPVSKYAGFDWRDNVALIGGLAAKEVIVSTMATMYGIDDEPKAANDVGEADSDGGWTMLKAFVFLLFVILYSPCLATCVVIWRETGHVKYMLATILYTNALALFLAVVVYQMGRLFL